ncbi:MBL fold metallo-hydrolase [Candidatus Sumerlaeota bacterium]|nr:MBL fold metallo-hydrolase [Candidatus Sumerlaeota bacterium]
MHVVEFEGLRVLLECGLFQGRRSESRERNLNFPFEPDEIHSCVLSHAHIDHSGNIPNLVKKGFEGTIFATRATQDLCGAMLRDSAKIHEHDASWLNKRAQRQGKPPIEPLYTMEDAEASLYNFHGLAYGRPFHILRHLRCTFHDAGHILGSAISHLEIGEGAQRHHLVFTGDLGRQNMPILRNPQIPPGADTLIMESTYGNRCHVPVGDTRRQMLEAIGPALARGGKVIIPSFSVGRTQEIVYHLRHLWHEDALPRVPVFVDSPLSVNVTEVFRHHPECYDRETRDILLAEGNGANDPFGFATLQYVRDVERSKELNGLTMPCIIISSSGMCEAGRILHHLRNTIEDSRNLILITGHMAQNTLGRRLAEGHEEVRIFGEPHRVRAEVRVITSLSAHADSDDLVGFAVELNRRHPLRRIFLVHGEEEPRRALAERLRAEIPAEVISPEMGRHYPL